MSAKLSSQVLYKRKKNPELDNFLGYDRDQNGISNLTSIFVTVAVTGVQMA